MADTRDARPPTDEETAPLLQDVDHPNADSQPQRSSFASIMHEPLTPLTKVLLVVTLLFLLLSSTFIGLFAGAQHKLNTGHGGDSPATVTSTVYATATQTQTSTSTSTSTVSVPGPVPTGPPEDPACLSADCIILSSSILSSLDSSQDPCENFYDFANGGWLKEHPIPSDKGVYGNFEALAQQNRRVLQDILTSDAYVSPSTLTASYDEQLMKKLRGLYASCMNEGKLNELGTEPLAAVTNNIRKLLYGETTVVGDKAPHILEKKITGLTAAIAYLHTRGIGGLFETSIEGDVGADPNFMTLWFSQPELGLPSKEYYDEDSFVELYQEVLERLLITLSEEEEYIDAPELSATRSEEVVYQERLRVWPPWPWPPWGGDGDDDDHDGDDEPEPMDPEKAHKVAKNVIKFEKAIANASLDLDILYQDPIATYNPVPIDNLTEQLPQIDFPEYFAAFTPRNYPNTAILMSVTYPSSLSAILNETNAETLEGYLVTRAALALAPYLGYETEAWKAVRSLEERLKGLKKGAVGDRAEFCTTEVESALGFATGRYFVNETFAGDSKKKGTQIIKDIIETFKSSLRHLEWMDKESATAAAEKADAIRVKVGYPLSPDTENPASIALYYSRVEIDSETFLENILSSNANEEYLTWQKLGKQRDPETWEMYPSTVNAYFNPPANEIVFPAGILQPPFFSRTWPGYLSYGSFGQVAAHELTHAFDSAGRMYNQHGKLEQWWTNATSEGFKERQDCIVKQYSEYTIDDGKGGVIHVNGNLTSGENIGDTGLIQSYRAWKAQYESGLANGSEYLLPGLNFTREQLFFISFARGWARNIKTESAVARVRTDPHSPNQYRVDGTVYNIPEFAKAFGCSAKAKLNPPKEKRCLFW
ncbi:zincin [Daedalea quercina L-15889]|uniref:Zincin n=1 Tax=Daedalea quercina L-15889 TaxID=1314783 RepID=A0A165PGB7_9APHY|nr:zincin [Daedalea quercina L-15889]